MNRYAMAAQFTPITADDMLKFLGRAFHALHPSRPFNKNGEMVVDLALNDAKTIGVRVWTSIGADASQSSAVGTDAIRVQFYNFAKNKPMLTGKAPIVKRTQNWRDNLKDRIIDVMEQYDDREDYWESRVL